LNLLEPQTYGLDDEPFQVVQPEASESPGLCEISQPVWIERRSQAPVVLLQSHIRHSFQSARWSREELIPPALGVYLL